MPDFPETSNALQVDGNAGDHYHFTDGGWVRRSDGQAPVGGAYHMFENGAAHLLINSALTAV